MFRDRDEALEDLQQQLLEEEPEPEYLDADALEELLHPEQPGQAPRVYQNYANDYGSQLRNYASGYKAYNADKADVDIDEYSDAVDAPEGGSKLVWLLITVVLLMTAVVGAIAWHFLQTGGLLP